MTPVEEIKDRLSIVDVVSAYVRLEPAGKNLKAKSPFSNEKTASFFVSPDKGLFHCFSTGKGGDMFTFVEEMEGLDFRGALKVLAEKAGVSLERYDSKAGEEKDTLRQAVEEACKFFESHLAQNEEAQKYLVERGVAPESVKIWRLGYAPADWRELYEHLKKDFSDEIILKAGLGKKSEKGVYDTFRDRIMFPICDSAGRVIAFSGRILHPDEKSAKYINSPDTPLFNKSDTLFGLDKAKSFIRKYDFAILAEGQFDVLMLHQSGFRNAVGVSGTALSEDVVSAENRVNNLGLIKRISNNLILCFDSDKAGINATKRSAGIALSLGMDVKVVSLAEDGEGSKDPADYLLASGKEAFSAKLKGAVHVIEFLAQKAKDRARDQRDLGRILKAEVLPEVARLSGAMEKDFFVKKIAEITGIEESVIWKDVPAMPAGERKMSFSSAEDESKKISKKDKIERTLLGFYFAQNEDEKIKKALVDVLGQERFDELLEKLTAQKDELVFEAERLNNQSEAENLTSEMLINLEEAYTQEMLDETKSNIRKAESLNLDEEAEKLVAKSQDLAARLAEIRNSRHLHKY